jgi:hypothetical protein
LAVDTLRKDGVLLVADVDEGRAVIFGSVRSDNLIEWAFLTLPPKSGGA